MIYIIKKTVKKIIGCISYLYLLYCYKYNNRKIANYGHLKYVRWYSNENFVLLKKKNDSLNCDAINKKNIINIGFVLYTSSMWNVDELYKKLDSDPKFNVQIVVAHKQMKDDNSSENEYQKTLLYFRNLGYNTIEANNAIIKEFNSLFYLTIGDLAEKEVKYNNISLETIILHTSYSYMLTANSNKLHAIVYHISLRYYTDTQYYLSEISKQNCYTNNAVFFGYPKMDQFYIANTIRLSSKIVIIYAPHHSVNYKENKSATFEDNYLDILKLAKKYEDLTFWIYKPHPLLRSSSVAAKIFKNVEEYDDYENAWENMSNAVVIDKGDYFPIFKGSDAMITDSVSFLAEYQFTHKPLLLLQSGRENYNQFGKSIIEVLYKCSGRDIKSIEKYINLVINGEDYMKEQRDFFFKENLYYMNDNKTANIKIYEDILNITNKEN